MISLIVPKQLLFAVTELLCILSIVAMFDTGRKDDLPVSLYLGRYKR